MTAVTTTKEVNREEIRMLVADIGYSETSARTGIKEPTLRQWAHRFGWSMPIVHSQAVTTVTQRPGDAHAEALAHHEGHTRLTLAKYAHNASRAIHRSVHPAKWTKEAKDLASVMATVHRQDREKPAVTFSLNVLSLSMLSDDETTSPGT